MSKTVCACGCGGFVTFDRLGKPNKFIRGHNSRCSPETMSSQNSVPPLCKCGCNRPVEWDVRHKRWRVYIKDHRHTNSARANVSETPPLCKCGCKQRVNQKTRFGKWWKFLEGHRGAGSKYPPIGEAAPRCACGCNQPVAWHVQNKSWNTYIHGHLSGTPEWREKAKQQSLTNWADPIASAKMLKGIRSMYTDPEVAKRQRENHLAAVRTPEHRKQASERMEKRWQCPEYRELQEQINRDYWDDPEFRRKQADVRATPEYIAKQREAKLLLYADPVYAQKCRDTHNTPEYKEKASIRNKAQWQDADYVRKVKAAMNTPECKRKKSESYKRSWDNPERRKATSETQIALWKDPEHVEKMMIARGRRPNGLETLFDNLTIDKIAYVGDGTFFKTWPNGRIKNPDFKIEGQKRIVELFGDYFHQDDDIQLHMEMWHRIGYEVLILWEHEIHDTQSEILDLVSSFIGEDAREENNVAVN